MSLRGSNPCSIPYEILCHCEEQSDVAISRKGIILNPTQDTFVLAWRKGAHEQKTTDCRLRQSVGQKRSYRGPRGILCTRGEKEHTSKRVSIIACDNVISKAKLSGTPRDTVYSRGKGVCEHKTTDCRLRQSVGQKRSIRRVAVAALHCSYYLFFS